MHAPALAWNAIGSITSAAQSFVFLTAVTRIMGTEVAGDYSIGTAIAQLMWTIGVFDQASYLVTDSKGRFSLEQYYAFKILSCLAMVIGSVVYILTFGFAFDKALMAFLLCLYKLVDAYGGFYHAVFQKMGHLDVSGFALFVENLSAMVAFVPMLFITRQLSLSIAFCTVVMLICTLAVYHRNMNGLFSVGRPDFSYRKTVDQFLQLLPLFVASFLYSYLANVPRYAIEAAGTNTMQAVFNVLFMPSFAISLCVRFILKPSTTMLTTLWTEHRTRDFLVLVGRLLLGDLAITIAAMVGAWLLGIPVLELVFGIDLHGYVWMLVLLLFASGVMVASDVLYYPIVIFRKQVGTVVAYGTALGVGTICANRLVATMGIAGAALSYLLEAGAVCIVFLVIIVRAIQEATQSSAR